MRGFTLGKNSSSQKGIFYGWWMALSCAIMNFFIWRFIFLWFYGLLQPHPADLRLDRGSNPIAFTFQRLESGIAGPIVGFLVDKVGPRKLMVAGWITVGVSFFSDEPNRLPLGILRFFLPGCGRFQFRIFCGDERRHSQLVQQEEKPGLDHRLCRFRAKRLAGSPGIPGRYPVWLERNITIVALVSWLIGLPLSLVMRHKPAPYGYFPDGETESPAGLTPDLPKEELILKGPSSSTDGLTAGEAIKTRAFWLLSAVFFFQQIGTTAIIIHIVPYLESIQVSSTLAAMAVTGLTLCSLVGRVFFGLLGDFRDKRVLITITVVLQVIGMFILSAIDAENTWLVVVFLFIYGLGYGGPIPLRPALQADYFGTKGFGTILGLMSLVTMVSGLVSPVVAGMIFDSTGSYKTAWDIFALITIPAVPLMLLAKPPKVIDTKSAD